MYMSYMRHLIIPEMFWQIYPVCRFNLKFILNSDKVSSTKKNEIELKQMIVHFNELYAMLVCTIDMVVSSSGGGGAHLVSNI